MKKTFIIFVLVLTSSYSVYASESANYLSGLGIIEKKSVLSEYRLNDPITRAEVSKIIGLADRQIYDCKNIYFDVKQEDWSCKYISSLYQRGIIKKSILFRPNDNITEIEALKIVMLSKGIAKGNESDWRKAYENKALDIGLISNKINYDQLATREFIFNLVYILDLALKYKEAEESIELSAFGNLLLDLKKNYEIYNSKEIAMKQKTPSHINISTLLSKELEEYTVEMIKISSKISDLYVEDSTLGDKELLYSHIKEAKKLRENKYIELAQAYNLIKDKYSGMGGNTFRRMLEGKENEINKHILILDVYIDLLESYDL